MLTYEPIMDFDVEMADSDDVKQFELQRAIEHLDRKLARKLILDDGIQPTTITPHLLQFLRVAVESRDPSLVKELLKLKPDLNCSEGGQILWIVVEDGDTEISTMLVQAGANLNEQMRGCNFLHVLISSESQKKHQLALLMIELGADVNSRDYNGFTPLYFAVQQQSIHLIVELLRKNAVVDDFVVTYAAIKSAEAADLLPMLIQSHRVDLETRDRQAVCAIMYLITQNNQNRVAIIQALLDIGVPVDIVNSCGWTSLVFATIFERVGVVDLLLKYNADVNKKSANGVLPIFVASSLEESTIAQMLIKKGANIHDHNDVDRQYPIHAACANESLSNIHLLLSLGADINVIDRSERTAFSLLDTAETLNPCTKYIIKHFALLVSKGSMINDLDLLIIYESSHTQNLYEDCLEELERMKRTKIYNDISFFCVFSKNIQELSLLIRNPDFLKSYNMKPKKSLFPLYFADMSVAFRNAEKRKNILVYKENTLNKITKGILPNIALRKIAYYLCLYDLQSV